MNNKKEFFITEGAIDNFAKVAGVYIEDVLDIYYKANKKLHGVFFMTKAINGEKFKNPLMQAEAEKLREDFTNAVILRNTAAVKLCKEIGRLNGICKKMTGADMLSRMYDYGAIKIGAKKIPEPLSMIEEFCSLCDSLVDWQDEIKEIC